MIYVHQLIIINIMHKSEMQMRWELKTAAINNLIPSDWESHDTWPTDINIIHSIYYKDYTFILDLPKYFFRS